MRLFPLVAIAALFLTSACGYTTVRSAPNFERTLQEHNHNNQSMIAALPPEISVVEHSMDGDKRMDQYEYGLEDIVSEQLIAMLQQKGYSARNVRRRAIHDAGQMRNYMDLRQTYNQQIPPLYARPQKEEVAFNTRINLGEKAIAVGKATGYDVLMFIDYSGGVASSGKQIMNALIAGLAGGGTQNYPSTLLITLVDAKSGELLWSNQSLDVTGISIKRNAEAQQREDNMQLHTMADQLFSQLPNKDQLNQPKKQ